MKLFLRSNQININDVFFLDKKNNMIMDGKFTKLIYSNRFLTLNSLYILLPIKNATVQKNVLFFNVFQNEDVIQSIESVEKQLLQTYLDFYGINKTPIHSLRYNLKNGSVKFYKHDAFHRNTMYYIKISGVWENATEIGVTYKIIEH